MLHTSESYGYNSFIKITIKSMRQVVKSNTIVTNYFTTFLQNIDVTNFLLIFTSPPLISLFNLSNFDSHDLRDILLVLTCKTRRSKQGINV